MEFSKKTESLRKLYEALCYKEEKYGVNSLRSDSYDEVIESMKAQITVNRKILRHFREQVKDVIYEMVTSDEPLI